MTTVAYSHVFPYVNLGGASSPALQMRIQAPGQRDAIDVDAFLDSGASASLFDGSILQGIGLNLLDGATITYQSTFGAAVEARVHRVQLAHEQLGGFNLDVGFSTGQITRNLLGRDFFNLIQIGFREHQLAFLIEPSP